MKKSLTIACLVWVAMIAAGSPVQAASDVCMADTSAEVKKCIAQLTNKTVKAIEITKSIICNTATDCAFELNRVTGGSIYGTPGANVGFTRNHGAFTTSIFRVIYSNNIIFSNLVFNDNPNEPGCTWISWEEPTACKSQIFANSAPNLTFINLTLTNSKSQAIAVIGASKNITLKNSTVTNTYEQGVIFHPYTPKIDTLLIEGNVFTKTGGAAIAINVNNITIKNNELTYSQWKTPWKIGGGQINMNGVTGAVITGNNVFNGTALNESRKEYIGGIEFSRDSSDVTIEKNSITGNSAPGFQNDFTPDQVVLNDVFMRHNRLSGNGGNWLSNRTYNVPPDWDGAFFDLTHQSAHWKFENNCTREPCTTPEANGTMSLSPNPCYIKPGQTTCMMAVSWMTNFAAGVKVQKGTSEIGTGNRGSRVVTVGSEGARMTLTANNRTLATTEGVALSAGGTKPGDLNGDNKVDIFDYNLLVAKFNNPYTIFDYNTLVANYGK